MQALIEHLAERFGDVQLGHRRIIGVEQALHVHFQATIDEGSRHHRLGLALGQLEAGVLQGEQRFAEGFALTGVGDGVGDRGFQRRDGADGDGQGARRQAA